MTNKLKPERGRKGENIMDNKFDNNGNIFETNLPLDDFGASEFTLRERLDFSGHSSGRVTPHVNAELTDSSGNVLSRDLANTQLPGFNGMQTVKE